MGYAVRVDGDRVAAAAAQLSRVGEDLERAGEALARALRMAAGASGAGVLAQAADAAAGEWRAGMGRIAEHGRELGRQTGRAAEAYRAVESATTGVWGPRQGVRGLP